MIVVEHWYDFICPFCYIAQDRNAVLRWTGIEVIDLPFPIRPDIGPGGLPAPTRSGPMYDRLRVEAKRAGLSLAWSDRIAHSRLALIHAEIVRRHEPMRHAEFCRVVFDAYFAHGCDIGESDVLDACATEAGVAASLFTDALQLRTGATDVDRSHQRAKTLGVSATPAWLIDNELVVGLRSHKDFQRIAVELTAATQR